MQGRTRIVQIKFGRKKLSSPSTAQAANGIFSTDSIATMKKMMPVAFPTTLNDRKVGRKLNVTENKKQR